MDINQHQVWKNIAPYKKPLHLLRILFARNFTKLYSRERFVGITGSVGKTTTKEACLAVLSQKYSTIASHGNLDPIFNIPITLLKLRPQVKRVVLEMGIEYPGEMQFYLSLVQPATAIVTRISFAHSEFLGGLEDIYREKGVLVRQLPENGVAILNGDDVWCRKLAKETKAQILFYGLDRNRCDVWGSNIEVKNKGTKFELNYGVERVEIQLKLLGRHFVYPALAAASLGIANNLSLIKIKKGLEEMQSVEHRLQLMEGVNDSLVLDDTYNSSPAAVEEALNVLNALPARRRIVVLGEMRELGSYSEQLHREVARQIYKDKFDIVYLGMGEAKWIGDELVKLGFMSEKLEVNMSNTQLVSHLVRILGKGDVVLIKGSRAVKLDEVAQRVKKTNRG